MRYTTDELKLELPFNAKSFSKKNIETHLKCFLNNGLSSDEQVFFLEWLSKNHNRIKYKKSYDICHKILSSSNISPSKLSTGFLDTYIEIGELNIVILIFEKYENEKGFLDVFNKHTRVNHYFVTACRFGHISIVDFIYNTYKETTSIHVNQISRAFDHQQPHIASFLIKKEKIFQLFLKLNIPDKNNVLLKIKQYDIQNKLHDF